MLKLNTKIYKPIEFEIDGKVFQTRKITNRVLIDGPQISAKMQAAKSTEESVQYMADLLVLYTPLEKEWILDNFDPEDMQRIVGYITEEITKATGVAAEPPLAGGATGEESPK